ncbi:MAG: signal peptidase I [Clostridiaceae bacterium]
MKRRESTKCLILLSIILGIYLLENLRFIKINTKAYFVYGIMPIIWIALIILVWCFRRLTHKIKLSKIRDIKIWVMYIAIFYIIALFFLGCIQGFGKSPYDISLVGIVRNFIVFFSAIWGTELVRSYLTNSLTKNKVEKRSIITMSIIVILFTLLNLSINSIKNIADMKSLVQYIGETALPELSINILATYLVYIGGAELSIIYIGIIKMANYIAPILPDINWITSSLIGILCPLFGLMAIEYIYENTNRRKNKAKGKKKSENPVYSMIVCVISILLIWFVVGVFPIQPYVIATGSMEPEIKPGDVVLVKKMPGDKVEQGDIIQYKSEDIYIFHRIIGSEEQENQLKLKTKGDNNSAPDQDLVSLENVKGKVIHVIPKIGWPTLLFKSENSPGKQQVEF